MKSRFISLLFASVLLSVSVTGCGDVNKSDADAVDSEDPSETGSETVSDGDETPEDDSSDNKEVTGTPDNEKGEDPSEPSGKDQSIKKKMKSEEVFDIIYGSWVSDDGNDELIFSA
ncbi:MAG: hypothetical protein J6P89_10540, partial [Oscillospiraceae bacterium]|nr:hypothetical protein [Oscillospiraceae bacterium]